MMGFIFINRGFFLLIYLLCFGCGTKVGNPKQPDTDTSNDKQVELPQIDFNIDESLTASEANLNLSAAFGMVQKRLLRAGGLVVEFHAVMDILKENNISELKKYEFVFNESPIEANLTESSKEGFDYKMVLSSSNEKFMSVHWTKESGKVQIIQTFSFYPFNSEVEKSRSNLINFEKGETSSFLNFVSQGTGFVSDSILSADGDYLTEYVALEEDLEGNIVLRSVGDWHGESANDGPFSGDIYLLADIKLNGDQHFIGHYKDLLLCGSFSESNPSDGFCFSGVLGSLRVDYDATILQTRVSQILPLGIVTQDKLSKVPLPIE